MLVEIPASVWLLLVAVISSAIPFVYIIKHLTQSPDRHSAAEPDDDYSWRSTRNLVVNGATLSVTTSAMIGVIASLPRGAIGPAVIYVVFIALFGAFPVYLVWKGIKTGQIMPMASQAWLLETRRVTHPKTFWAYVVWNLIFALLGMSMPVLVFASVLSGTS